MPFIMSTLYATKSKAYLVDFTELYTYLCNRISTIIQQTYMCLVFDEVDVLLQDSDNTTHPTHRGWHTRSSIET